MVSVLNWVKFNKRFFWIAAHLVQTEPSWKSRGATQGVLLIGTVNFEHVVYLVGVN